MSVEKEMKVSQVIKKGGEVVKGTATGAINIIRSPVKIMNRSKLSKVLPKSSKKTIGTSPGTLVYEGKEKDEVKIQ